MKVIFAAVIVILTASLAWSATINASPDTGECVQDGHDLILLVLDSPNDTEVGNLGDAIADGFFGNEPNLLNTNTNDDLGPEEVAPGSSAGEVVGSSSPGPGTIGGGFTTWGSLVGGSVPAGCV